LPTIKVRLTGQDTSYPIIVRGGLLADASALIPADLRSRIRTVAVISNEKVFGLYGSALVRSLKGAGMRVLHWQMPDGERFKSLKTLEKALAFLAESRIERTDAVVALGGGVVGDLAGFAAATYMRGIDLIQIPTTLLSQIDSSVGGKTGVNVPSGKNLVGAFHHPRVVFIDTDTISTLPRRELTAGWCEAIKQGAAGDRKLFDDTHKFLNSHGTEGKPGAASKLNSLIARQCSFKAGIVQGDERESVQRIDRRSRKILNFGHTTAHALEAITAYRRFRHGEAVGLGMLVAGEISKRLGMLPSFELELLEQAVQACGHLPRADDLDVTGIINLISSDKKSTKGSVKWVLLEAIGRAAIVDGAQIPPQLLRIAISTALSR
jgi:3-dehydroquinate synthase